MIARIFTVAMLVAATCVVLAFQPVVGGNDNPVELGAVSWLRDFDAALAKSRETEKPVLVLFQEVPGCGTCTRYGTEVLSHPQLVEAIERYFVPVAVYNNHSGKDAQVLKSFDEPAWANPVVRIMDENRHDIAPRLHANYSPLGMIETLQAALHHEGIELPVYLSLLAEEYRAKERGTQTATYQVHCFWTGEAELGDENGVIDTEPGFVGGSEVVTVTYNPHETSETALSQATKGHKIPAEKAKQFRADSEQHYYLRNSKLRFVPMTLIQQTRVNAALGADAEYLHYLSPRQQRLWVFVRNHPDLKWWNALDDPDLVRAWQKADQLMP